MHATGAKAKKVKPLTYYHRLFKCWPSAILFDQIVYWWPKARIRRKGRIWIAKSAEDWCEETELTMKQYRTAIAKLRRIRIIETGQYPFQGKVITHVTMANPDTELNLPG
jgi:hypothetical protein